MALTTNGGGNGPLPVRTRREADTADNLREARCEGLPPLTPLARSGEAPKAPPMDPGLKAHEPAPRAGVRRGGRTSPPHVMGHPGEPAQGKPKRTPRALRAAPHARRTAAVLRTAT